MKSVNAVASRSRHELRCRSGLAPVNAGHYRLRVDVVRDCPAPIPLVYRQIERVVRNVEADDLVLHDREQHSLDGRALPLRRGQPAEAGRVLPVQAERDEPRP